MTRIEPTLNPEMYGPPPPTTHQLIDQLRDELAAVQALLQRLNERLDNFSKCLSDLMKDFAP